ncbi:MAG: DinB family protein [Rubrivivax sp.]|nr:DinB family protein [Rubrivivax sp.]
MTRSLRMLTRYTAWADARLFDALAALPAGVAEARREGRSASMLSTLGHCQVVDLIWQANLEGRAHGFESRQMAALPALAALAAKQAELDRWYIARADTLAPDALDEVLPFSFVGGRAGAMSRAEMLLHVVNHKTYHRGYVAEMLYAAGQQPPAMDLTVYLRDAAPAA